MRYANALKAPAPSYKLPAWATMHNLVASVIVAVALLVIVLLVRAVGRLAKAVGAAAAPAPVPKKSGGGGKLLLAGAAGAAGWLLWEGRHSTAAPVKAAPAPSPHPTPTVTRTVAPHATPHLPSFAFLNHLTGTDWVLIVLIGAVVTFAIVRPLLRRGD